MTTDFSEHLLEHRLTLATVIQELNAEQAADHAFHYHHIAELLDRRGLDVQEIIEKIKRVEALKEKLKEDKSAEGRQLLSVADPLVKKSDWIMCGS